MKKYLAVLLLTLIAAQVSFGATAYKKMKMKAKVSKVEKIKCPVTGGLVDPATTTLKSVYKGKTYYFCCPGCPEEFKKNPEKYLKKTEQHKPGNK